MANASEFGAFIPTTQLYDAAEILSVDVNSPQFKELFVRLWQYYNIVALNVNVKDTGYYLPTEFVNGQAWFSNPSLSDITPNSQSPTLRQDYRMVVNFGALPNATSKSVPHGLTLDANCTVTRLYAAATKPTATFSYIPIPYVAVNPANENIELRVDDTNVTIVTQSDRTAYTFCYVVFEYLRS